MGKNFFFQKHKKKSGTTYTDYTNIPPLSPCPPPHLPLYAVRKYISKKSKKKVGYKKKRLATMISYKSKSSQNIHPCKAPNPPTQTPSSPNGQNVRLGNSDLPPLSSPLSSPLPPPGLIILNTKISNQEECVKSTFF